MIKPANIILTLVGTAVVGGTAINLLRPRSRPRYDDDWGTTSAPSGARPVATHRSYPNNYFVQGLGYYHAPYYAFFPKRFNEQDPAQGYYYGGEWHAAASNSTVTSSTPSDSELARLRQALGSGSAVEEYPNDYYVQGMGYYHAPHHSFFPYRFNSYDPGRGYYYGGSWWPTASPSTVRSSSPSGSTMANLKRAFTTGKMVSSSGGQSFTSHSVGSAAGSVSRPTSSSGNAGSVASSSVGHTSSPSVSRGGFGSSAHSSSGSSGASS